MKARLMIAALAFVALSSVAVAQDKTTKTECTKAKTECCKAKEADKATCSDKTKTSEKKAGKTVETKTSAKVADTKK